MCYISITAVTTYIIATDVISPITRLVAKFQFVKIFIKIYIITYSYISTLEAESLIGSMSRLLLTVWLQVERLHRRRLISMGPRK